CAATTIARLLGALGQYVYSADDEGLAVHLFAQSSASLCVACQQVRVQQISEYPWSGTVSIELEAERAAPFTIRLRIPGWSRRASIRVNGELDRSPLRMGYLHINREWRGGDSIELEIH